MNTELYTAGKTICCVTCNKTLQAEILNNSFFQHLAILLVTVVLLALAVLVMQYAYRRRVDKYRAILNPAPLITAALVLGIGMGGFVDGIFHLFMMVAVGVGIVLLWRVGQRRAVDKSGQLLVGGMLAGWGMFNIVEGLINHQLVGLHNVREVASPDVWNHGFLIVSVLMLSGGIVVMRHRGYKPPANSASIH